MGLELSEDVIRQNMPEYLVQNQTALVRPPQVKALYHYVRKEFGQVCGKMGY